jgi:hypothetical protein
MCKGSYQPPEKSKRLRASGQSLAASAEKSNPAKWLGFYLGEILNIERCVMSA